LIGTIGVLQVLLELGAKKSKRKEENLERLALFFPFEILPFTGNSAKFYGDIRNKLLIAAEALESDLTLVTKNKKEFSRISNLKLDNWI
jgi:tRNA(fMet)-specific endonuclease VapC